MSVETVLLWTMFAWMFTFICTLLYSEHNDDTAGIVSICLAPICFLLTLWLVVSAFQSPQEDYLEELDNGGYRVVYRQTYKGIQWNVPDKIED